MLTNKIIHVPIAKQILFLGVSMKTKGGMTAVLVSYKKYIDGMRFIPTWKLGNKAVKTWYAVQALVRTWWLCQFDHNIKIIHIHGAANASFYRCQMFIRLAKRFGKKVILHEHAADFVEFYNAATNKTGIVKTLNTCDCLIVLSKSWKEYFSSIGVEEQKIRVLNNIVSPPEAEKQSHSDGKLHLLYMGEISNRKGAFDLLKAISNNKDYFKDKLLLRMGGNEVDGDIKAYIREHNLDGFVSYEGWISGQKKTNCLTWEDVYILPSHNEGLPIAILEAMSYSHPVISTPVGGIPEVIENGKNGTLIEPGNTEEIAAAIRHYIEQPAAIDVEGKASHDKIKAFYPEAVFEELEKIYIQLLMPL